MKSTLRITGMLVLSALVIWATLACATTRQPHAVNARLEHAAQQIAAETLTPGQVAYFKYTERVRIPPAHLEPPDPYHLPYSAIWMEEQVVESWVEIGEGQHVLRWRTLVRNPQGEVQQDNLFDGMTESTYFPAQGYAVRLETTADQYIDPRTLYIQEFLNNASLHRVITADPQGNKIIRVYTAPQPLENTLSVDEALHNHLRPFVADLDLATIGKRIDFDEATSTPLREATVYFDQHGAETIASSQQIVAPTILDPTDAQRKAIFAQTVPPEAYDGGIDFSHVARNVTELQEIFQATAYAVYGLIDVSDAWELKTTVLRVRKDGYIPPASFWGVEFIPLVGTGVHTTYSHLTHPEKSLLLIQGDIAEMQSALQQTVPQWTKSSPHQILLANDVVPGWIMWTDGEAASMAVLELSDSLLYVRSKGLARDELQAWLQHLAPLEQ
jgi:hypothetical protein